MVFLEWLRGTGRDLAVPKATQPITERFLHREPILSPEVEDLLKPLDLHIKSLTELHGFTEEVTVGQPSTSKYQGNREHIVIQTVGFRVAERQFSGSFNYRTIGALTSIIVEVHKFKTPTTRYSHALETLSPTPDQGLVSYGFVRVVGKERPPLASEEAEAFVHDLLSTEFDPELTQQLWESAQRDESKYILEYAKHWNNPSSNK